MLKILMEPDTHLEEHAKELHKYYGERMRQPRLGSVSRAMTPELCDECGATYWKPVDTWGPHPHCEGAPKKGLGFEA